MFQSGTFYFIFLWQDKLDQLTLQKPQEVISTRTIS